MSGFSPEWLAMREAADHRARNKDLLAALGERFRARDTLSIVDLGCGTGSNLRAVSAALPVRQHWSLVDHDPALLRAAQTRITAWADRAETVGPDLHVTKDARNLTISFLQVDLVTELDRALAGPADLVTAAALFDLVSASWIERFVSALTRHGAVFYTALTYNGEERWAPPHPADEAMLRAFHAHQKGDKGFGPSAGPTAIHLLTSALASAGYEIRSGESPWLLAGQDAPLVRELAFGIAAAVRETRQVPETTVSEWLRARSSGASCRVGHTDVLAVPSRSSPR
jgi:SAM-dependent methyltransferase